MIHLAIIRHGHTSWNRQGRIQGSTDIPLDDQAIADLAAFTLPEPWSGAELVSSPLQRAVQTARMIGAQEPKAVPALSEMDWGHWEGKRGVDLKADPSSGFRDIESWGWDFQPPSGETPRKVAARLLPWVWGLKADTVAVCHIGIMRVLLAQAYGWDFNGVAPFRIKRNRMYVLGVEETEITVIGEPIRLEVR
jgi:broad specificity phosphatase PhoE